MAHAFVSGFAAPQRTRLQQGAVALLSGLKRSAGGYLMEVLPFAFTVDAIGSSDDVAQFVATMSRAPSIAIHTGDREDIPVGIGGFNAKGEIELLVYCSSNNARGQQVGRLEIDTAGQASPMADPGLHVVMEHARELLQGQRAALGGDIKQIRFVSEREVITAQPITIWLQTYKVTVDFMIDEYRNVQQLLTSLRMRLAQDRAEVPPPAGSVALTSIDIQVDDL